MIWACRRHTFDLRQRALVMGVLNLTPDSFSDGGEYPHVDAAVAAGAAMVAAGADILDLGGESTRPGAPPVSVEEELARVLPVVQALRQATDCALSIDTTKAVVADACLAAGADILNDIHGFTGDPALAAAVRQYSAGCVVMHMRGTPATMQQHTTYADLLGELNTFFAERLATLTALGIPAAALCFDPGIGFAKTAEQNLLLLKHLDRFLGHGRPLLAGPSRKSFIGKVLHQPDPRQRTWGTAAAVTAAVLRGARVLRVHDVAAMRQVVDLAMAIAQAE